MRKEKKGFSLPITTMKKTNKLLAIILTFIMLLSFASVYAFAASDVSEASVEAITEVSDKVAVFSHDVETEDSKEVEDTKNTGENESTDIDSADSTLTVGAKEEKSEDGKIVIRSAVTLGNLDVKFNLINNDKGTLHEVSLSKENNYTMELDLEPGKYVITDISSDIESISITIKEKDFTIDQNTEEISLNISSEYKTMTFKGFLKKNAFLAIILLGAVVALYVNRAKNGEDLFPFLTALKENIGNKNK